MTGKPGVSTLGCTPEAPPPPCAPPPPEPPAILAVGLTAEPPAPPPTAFEPSAELFEPVDPWPDGDDAAPAPIRIAF